jgi:hypothetical protein
MKHSVTAMSCRSSILIASLCAFSWVSCKSIHKSDADEMRKSVAFPLTDAYEDRFAISPDGTSVVHAPTGVSASDGEHVRPFEVRDANTSARIAYIHLPIRPAIYEQINGIQFCDHGKYLLVNASVDFDPDHPPKSEKPRGQNAEVDFLRVVDMKSYTLHTDISLGTAEEDTPQQVLEQPHKAYELGGTLSYVVCAANAPIAVAVIGHALHLITIKVFNLETGAAVTGFNDVLLQSVVLGLAISPEATSLALFGPQRAQEMEDTTAVDYQVTIIDLQAKKVARTVPVQSPYNFNAIKYAGESTVAIELFDQGPSESPPFGWTGQLNYFHTRASIHFLDVGSGADVKTISRPDKGDFRLLGISADGRAMLVRTDTEHFCFSCNRGEGEEEITDSRFMLWSPQSGHPISRSPSLKVVHHWCLLPNSGPSIFGNCIPSDEEPELELSQGGNSVAALWKLGNQPILVYGLPVH